MPADRPDDHHRGNGQQLDGDPASPHTPPADPADPAAHVPARDGRTPLRPWPELMAAADAGPFCGLTVAAWRKLDKSGRCPPPRGWIGRRPMWARPDLLAWIDAGMPPRDAEAAAAYAAAVGGTLDALPGRRDKRADRRPKGGRPR